MSNKIILNKKVIYLDQFVISNIVKFLDGSTDNRIDGFWGNIYHKLHYLVKYLKIICPVSEIHGKETILIRDEDKQCKMEKLLTSLSLGVYLSSKHIKNMQLFEGALNWINKKSFSMNLDRNFIFENKINSWDYQEINEVKFTDDHTVIDEMEKDKKAFGDNLRSRWSEWKRKKITFKNQLKIELEAYKKVHLHLENSKDFEEIKDAFRLIGLSNSESDLKAVEFLNSSEIKEIPFCKIEPYLWAALAHQAGTTTKSSPNFSIFYDFRVLSRFAPYCDAIFVDKECYELTKFKEVQKVFRDYSIEIFSLNAKDDFISYLEEIEKTIDKDYKINIENHFNDTWFNQVQF